MLFLLPLVAGGRQWRGDRTWCHQCTCLCSCIHQDFRKLTGGKRKETEEHDPVIFKKRNSLLGPLTVDLFASRVTAHCQAYYSWQPEPYAIATDAFLQDWSKNTGFANPPWALIARVLAQVQAHKAQVVLVAPVWKTQPWYPTLLNMLTDLLIFPSFPGNKNICQSKLCKLMKQELAS